MSWVQNDANQFGLYLLNTNNRGSKTSTQGFVKAMSHKNHLSMRIIGMDKRSCFFSSSAVTGILGAHLGALVFGCQKLATI